MGWVAIIIGAIAVAAGGILYVVIGAMRQILLMIIPANQNIPWVLVSSIAIVAGILIAFAVVTIRTKTSPIN